METIPIIIDHISLLKTNQDFKNKHIFDEISKLIKELREKYGPIGKLINHGKN